MFLDTFLGRRLKSEVRARRRRAEQSRCGPPCRPMRLEPLEDRRLLGMLAFQDKLLAQEVPQGGDEFGCAVAVDGDTMVVGSRLHDVAGLSNAGAAYVFVRDDEGTPGDVSDDRWDFQAALTAGDAADDDQFGIDEVLSHTDNPG